MTENRDVLFYFIILYFPNHKIITVSNGSFRKTTGLILSIISLSSIQSNSSIYLLILFIHSLFKSCTTNITTFTKIPHLLYFSISFKYSPFYPSPPSLSPISFPNGRFIHSIFIIFNQSMQVPVLVLSIFYSFYPSLSIDQNTKRESGRKVQIGNIQAAKVIQSSHFHLLIRL